jgi:HK97 family phage prohead protease
VPKYVDQHSFREVAARGDAADVAVQRPAHVLRAGAGDSRVVRFVLSDGSVDRMGDTIDPAGWETDAYLKNPVVLWAHDALAPPIGRMLNVFSDGAQLIGDVEFAAPETYEYADQIYRLLRDGFLKAGSVGFLPIEFDFAKDRDRPLGVDFHRQELLEFSIVPVPANANALAEARAKGLFCDVAQFADRDADRPTVYAVWPSCGLRRAARRSAAACHDVSLLRYGGAAPRPVAVGSSIADHQRGGGRARSRDRLCRPRHRRRAPRHRCSISAVSRNDCKGTRLTALVPPGTALGQLARGADRGQRRGARQASVANLSSTRRASGTP